MLFYRPKIFKAVFGLIACFFGASIIVWCLYNVFIQSLPQNTGPSNILELLVGGFGIGPLLITCGKKWLGFPMRELEDE